MTLPAFALYLLQFHGQGDAQYTIVGPATWAWVQRPYAHPHMGTYEETIPEAALEEHYALTGKRWEEKKTIQITRGSYDNDRGLSAPGKTFHDIEDLSKWQKENGHGDFAGMYTGCIY